jgi:hypothetical protein
LPLDVPRAPVVLAALGAAGAGPGSIEDWMVVEIRGAFLNSAELFASRSSPMGTPTFMRIPSAPATSTSGQLAMVAGSDTEMGSIRLPQARLPE